MKKGNGEYCTPRFLLLDGDLSTNWRRFKVEWANLEFQFGFKKLKKTSRERVEIFLKLIGPVGVELYDKLIWEHEAVKFNIKKVLEHFDAHCLTPAKDTITNGRSSSDDEEENGDEEKWLQELKTTNHTFLSQTHQELKEDLKILDSTINFDSEESFSSMIDIKPNNVNCIPVDPPVIPKSISLLCWNIAGIEVFTKVGRRTQAIVDSIEQNEFDIILLQEVTSLVFNFLVKQLEEKYLVIRQDNKFSYFTVTLLKKETVKYHSHKIHPFRNTNVGRSILLTRASVGSAKLDIINVHLESTPNKTNSAYRRAQMQKCLDIASSTPGDFNVIVGGDMNIRDWEMKKINISKRICDLWVQQGSKPEDQYTWDMSVNKNLEMSKDFRPKLRFDRIFFRPSTPVAFTPEYFGLTGKQKLTGLELYPSDHWGLVAKFNLLPSAQVQLQSPGFEEPLVAQVEKLELLGTTTGRQDAWSDEDCEGPQSDLELVRDSWEDYD